MLASNSAPIQLKKSIYIYVYVHPEKKFGVKTAIIELFKKTNEIALLLDVTIRIYLQEH